MSLEVRPFRRGDREQLTALVNAHIAAVVPGGAGGLRRGGDPRRGGAARPAEAVRGHREPRRGRGTAPPRRRNLARRARGRVAPARPSRSAPRLRGARGRGVSDTVPRVRWIQRAHANRARLESAVCDQRLGGLRRSEALERRREQPSLCVEKPAHIRHAVALTETVSGTGFRTPSKWREEPVDEPARNRHDRA